LITTSYAEDKINISLSGEITTTYSQLDTLWTAYNNLAVANNLETGVKQQIIDLLKHTFR
ncbi:MAG: hypothetical protein NWP54_00260, partial [Polaribacter sp.]|nr:hypothetical protein [Polaribacter sp.]